MNEYFFHKNKTAILSKPEAPLQHWVSGHVMSYQDSSGVLPEDHHQESAALGSSVRERFKKNRLLRGAFYFLLLFLFSLIIVEFLAPYGQDMPNQELKSASPQFINLFHEGEFYGPFVYGYRQSPDGKGFVFDKNNIQSINLFCSGTPYSLWGLFQMRLHLMCGSGGQLHILGTDNQGTDVLSTLLYRARTSLLVSIGAVGVSLLISLFMGLVFIIGGRGVVLGLHNILQLIPGILFLVGFSMVFVVHESSFMGYGVLAFILGLYGYMYMGPRVIEYVNTVINSRFVYSARLMGASPLRIFGAYLLPNIYKSTLRCSLLLFPIILFADMLVSFLGSGMPDDALTWGISLRGAANLDIMQQAPWVLFPLIPLFCVMISVWYIGQKLDGER